MTVSSENIIEREYRFLISRNKLEIIPPSRVGEFKLTDTKTKIFKDYLFERESKTLKDENIGFRVREFEDGKIEFTYKKFLGREGGMARYDEFTKEITKEEANKLVKNEFTNSSLLILSELLKEGRLYYCLTIQNFRKVYMYGAGECAVELVLEDITYSNSGKSVKDAAMEIEIKTQESTLDKVNPMVEEIKKIYECVDQNEGKNTRALKLLGITLK